MTVDAIGPLPDLPKQLFIDKGGFGEVFRDPRQNGLCIKKFKQPLRGDGAQRIMRSIGIAASSSPSQRHLLITRLSWPIEAFGEHGDVHGYSMPEATADTRFMLTVVKKEQEKLLQAKFLIDGDYWKSAAVSSLPPAANTMDRIAIAIDFHDVMSQLHSFGLVYGDVSANNICIRRSNPMQVFLLDADSVMTPAERLNDQQKSPDWDVLPTLDPTEGDRARFALFVWRLLREKLTEYPSTTGAQELAQQRGVHFGDRLHQLYLHGDAATFEAIGGELRAALSPEFRARMFEADVRTQFAARVLRWPAQLLQPAHQALRDKAVAHVRAQGSIAVAHGFERRILLRTAGVNQEFVLDLPPGVESAPAPRSVEELEQLVFDAEFVAIASHLAGTGLGQLESHSFVDRAARHALWHRRDISPVVRSDLNQTTISWQWPPVPWINAAVVDVNVNGHVARDVVLRRTNDVSALREVRTAPGSSGVARITAAVLSPNGHLVLSDHVGERAFTTPLPPTPPRPRAGTPAQLLTAVQLVDPAEELRLAEEARRARKRKRLKIGASIAAIVLVLAGAYWYYRPVPFDAVAMEAISTPEGVALSWPAGVHDSSDPAARRYIETSADGGATWAISVNAPTPDSGQVTVASPNLDTFYRLVEYPTAEGFSSGSVLANSPVVRGTPAPPPLEAASARVAGADTYLLSWTLPSAHREEIDHLEVRSYSRVGSTASAFVADHNISVRSKRALIGVPGTEPRIWMRTVNNVGQPSEWVQVTVKPREG